MTLPARATFSTYGGAKVNDVPVEDPTTNENADERNEYVSDAAGMTQTAVRAIRAFLGHATTPADPGSGLIHRSVWGNDNAVKPTVVHTGTGIYDATWPTTVTDALGTVHTLALEGAFANVEQSDGTFRAAYAKVTGANTARIYTYSGTTLNDLVGERIVVYVH